MTEKEKSFEERLERLEEIVRTLEASPPSLKDSIQLYTEGKNLVKRCRTELEEAEQLVERIES